MNSIAHTSLSKKLLVILCIILLGTSISIAQQKNEFVSENEISIKSKFLDEERFVTIYLPDDYSFTSQKYPVMYLLDGRWNFQHATGAMNFLSKQGNIPKMIVVAIHNVDRNRDFSPAYDERIPTSGGAEKFLNFLSKELKTYMDETYRTNNFDLLFGHSFGGTFAVYSLLTNPKVFEAYIVASPYLHFVDNYLVKEAEVLLKPNYDGQKYFHMSVGNEPEYFSALGEFSDLIKKKSANRIDFKYTKMENEDHATIPYLSVFYGLKFVFSDWQLSEEKFVKGLASIDEHYKKTTAKYMLFRKTPENVINLLGYRYLRNNDFEKAIKVFSENVNRYPKSSNVYDSLGEAYERNNQLKLARKNYQKAVDLGKKFYSENMAIYEKNLKRVQ